MKKLLLSLAGLAVATALFTLQNIKTTEDKIPQNTIAKVDKAFQE